MLENLGIALSMDSYKLHTHVNISKCSALLVSHLHVAVVPFPLPGETVQSPHQFLV